MLSRGLQIYSPIPIVVAKIPTSSMTKIIISPPPQFMSSKPKEFKCEGYWSSNNHGYFPYPTSVVWTDKAKFVRAVQAIIKYLMDNNKFIQYRGIAFSRLQNGYAVGSMEYVDNDYNMCWPEGYIEHYIRDYNVMPTKKFYKYIMKRINTLPSEYRIGI